MCVCVCVERERERERDIYIDIDIYHTLGSPPGKIHTEILRHTDTQTYIYISTHTHTCLHIYAPYDQPAVSSLSHAIDRLSCFCVS